jgi:hypothetical protein
MLRSLLAGEQAQALELEEAKGRIELDKLLAGKGAQLDKATGAVTAIPNLAETQAQAEALSEKAKTEARIRAEGQAVPGVPKALQAEALKEVQTVAQKDQSLKFIEKKFKDAESLVGTGGAYVTDLTGMPTEKGNALKGLGDSLLTQVDTALGREMNSDVRERLLSLTPKRYDDKKTLANKATAMKELVSSLFDATPVLDSMAKPAAIPTPVATIPPGAIDTGRTSGGKKVYSVDGKLWVP